MWYPLDRKRRTRLAAAILAGAAGLILLAIPFIRGQGPPPIIDFLLCAQEIDSLRSALGDPAVDAALKARLASTALWHISTAPEGPGFRHTFWFAGRTRRTTRIAGLAVTTRPAAGGTYSVLPAGEEFSFLHLGGAPAIADETALAIARAGLGDESVRSTLVVELAQGRTTLRTMSVEGPSGSTRYRLCFTGRTEGGAEVTIAWKVEPLSEGGGSPWRFVAD